MQISGQGRNANGIDPDDPGRMPPTLDCSALDYLLATAGMTLTEA